MSLEFGRVERYLRSLIKKKGTLHVGLLDPEKTRVSEAVKIAEVLEESGSSAILMGGSMLVTESLLDETIKLIKDRVKIPVILFPGNVSGLSRYADAVLFMSLLNSTNPYFIVGAQMLGAPIIKRLGIEAIPTAYLIFYPGKTVSYIGEARLLPRDDPRIAASYALAAQYLGMRFVYLEAGSGAEEPLPSTLVSFIRRTIDNIVIVGGGIRTPKQAKEIADAGANIIITGTLVEEKNNLESKIKNIVDALG